MARLLIALVVALSGIACTTSTTPTSDDPVGSDPEPTPTPTAEAPVAAPTRLLYVDGRELHGFDFDSGAAELIAELPSADAALSPDGLHLAVVEETDPGGPGPEGFSMPAVTLRQIGGPDEARTLGPGRSPAWSADGTRIAAIAPTEQGESIVIYSPAGQEIPTAAARDELWSLVGWQNDDVVAIGSVSGVVLVPGDGARPRAYRVSPASFWGAAPVGSAFLALEQGAGVIVTKNGDQDIATGGALGDGTWSWDGKRIAVVVIDEDVNTRLTLIDATTGDAAAAAESRGAQGNVVWSQDSQRFAFVRVEPERPSRLEAIVCQGPTRCEPAFSWDEGVSLLGFSTG